MDRLAVYEWTNRNYPLGNLGSGLTIAAFRLVRLANNHNWGYIDVHTGVYCFSAIPVVDSSSGVAIGRNPRLAQVLQPVVQIAASVPATALFPILLLF
jgi:ABC-type anion transport system duplicated permease subunit